MNEMKFARSEANAFIAGNKNFSHRFVKLQLDGERRLEPSGPQARVRARREARERRDRGILDSVRLAMVHGIWNGMTSEEFVQRVDHLRSRGYADEDMTTPVVFDLPLMPLIREKFKV